MARALTFSGFVPAISPFWWFMSLTLDYPLYIPDIPDICHTFSVVLFFSFSSSLLCACFITYLFLLETTQPPDHFNSNSISDIQLASYVSSLESIHLNE